MSKASVTTKDDQSDSARLSTKAIPEALKALEGKRAYVNQVIQYCGSAYLTEDKDEIRKQTQDYLVEILETMCADINQVASNLNNFLDLQRKDYDSANAVEHIACQLDVVANHMQLPKELKTKALLDELRDEVVREDGTELPGNKQSQLAEDQDLPLEVTPDRKISVAERLAELDDYDVTAK